MYLALFVTEERSFPIILFSFKQKLRPHRRLRLQTRPLVDIYHTHLAMKSFAILSLFISASLAQSVSINFYEIIDC
jgi:hypothetical protein